MIFYVAPGRLIVARAVNEVLTVLTLLPSVGYTIYLVLNMTVYD